MSVVPTKEAPLTHEVAMETRRISLPHRDPADRFLVATANVFGLTLVTADEVLIKAKACASPRQPLKHLLR
jgi:PIN domain nuclease of toxin-antitoxin system